jgi:hypothetical protein
MTDFRTIVPIEKYKAPIDYQSQLFLIGSCFTEHISKKFNYFKFRNCSNPFGVLFHPLAIENILERAVNQKAFTENELICEQELYHCFEVHSEFSSLSPQDLLERLNQRLKETHLALQNASHIIITLGTSWVYRHLESDKIVANCHKIPQRTFGKELLSVAEIRNSLERIIQLFPDKNVLFTISPVRHIKDGYFENNVSKSHLFSAIYSILSNKVRYFPSYEIVMDELRDYRFFTEDMIHPNVVAIDYVWKRFSENYLAENTHPILKEIDSIQKALQHRPFNPDTEAHQNFIENTQKRIEKLGDIWF